MKKALLIILFISAQASFVGNVLAQDHNCDFGAVLAKEGYQITDVGEADYYFYDFIIQHSTQGDDNDGYGCLYLKEGQSIIPPSQKYYLVGTNISYAVEPPPKQLDLAHTAIMDPANDAVMVMAHARNGTGGNIPGNHPFIMEWEGKTYSFMHNGFIRSDGTPNIKWAFWNYLYNVWGGGGGVWFEGHPSNYVPHPGPTDNWQNFVDTELLFHWIMSHIIDHDGSILAGLYEALTGTVEGQGGSVIDLYSQFHNQVYSNTLNIVLNDSEALYVFRNRLNSGNDYYVSWSEFPEYVALRTDPPDGTEVPQFALVYIPRDHSPITFTNFLSLNRPLCFQSGTISTDTDWEGIVCLDGDLTITNGATLTLLEGMTLEFEGACDLVIQDGEMVMHNGGEVRLGDGSQVQIDGPTSALHLMNGSAISGFGVQDKVLSDNYGLIATERTNPVMNRTRLYSRSGDYWGGVEINRPRPYNTAADIYSFWNTDVSHCGDLRVAGCAAVIDEARLEFHYSAVTLSDHLLVRDGHMLSFVSSSYFNNVHSLTIDYNAKLEMAYASVEKNSWDGVLIGKTGGPVSIKASSFYGNGLSGIKSYSKIDYFGENKVVYNCCSPLPVDTPAGVKLMKGVKVAENGFRNNIFEENCRADYEAYYLAYDWQNQHNTFRNYHGCYVLICVDYDLQLLPVPRPVYGNTFFYQSQLQFLPRFSAFDFGDTSITP